MGVHGAVVPYIFKTSGYSLIGKDLLRLHGENLNDFNLLENPNSGCYSASWGNVLKNVYVVMNESVYSLEQDEDGNVWGVMVEVQDEDGEMWRVMI